MARPVYIVDGSRTPFLKARSGPGPFTPVDLAVQCGRPLLARQPFAPTAFDQVILGCVNVIADEMNPARVAALRLGMGEAMVAFTVQINCGSGMQSIDTGYRYIREGSSDLILAGGAEALSYAPLVWPQQGVRWFAGLAGAKGIARQDRGARRRRGRRYFKPIIGLERGLTDPITELNMGQTAEVVGHLFGITRAQSDAYAVESHKRLANAQAQGLAERRGRNRVRARRQVLRSRRRRAAGFLAGDAGQIEAGVRAALGPGHRRQLLADHRRRLLGDPRVRRGRGQTWPDAEGRDRRQPMVGARSQHHGARAGAVGDRTVEAQQADPAGRRDLGIERGVRDPGAGLPRRLERRKILPRDPWASTAPPAQIDRAKLNVDGGAISLGHPVGCSGNRIVLHLVNAMKRLGTKRGVATECIGGGQGGAMLIETV